jgi:hypothetical protein
MDFRMRATSASGDQTALFKSAFAHKYRSILNISLYCSHPTTLIIKSKFEWQLQGPEMEDRFCDAPSCMLAQKSGSSAISRYLDQFKNGIPKSILNFKFDFAWQLQGPNWRTPSTTPPAACWRGGRAVPGSPATSPLPTATLRTRLRTGGKVGCSRLQLGGASAELVGSGERTLCAKLLVKYIILQG